MNVQLLSLSNSPLSQVLLSDSNMSPFIYSVYSSLPPCSREKVELAGTNLGFGKSTSFAVPRYGILCGVVLKVAMTGTAMDAGLNLGNALIKNAVISSHSREIIRLETLGNLLNVLDKPQPTQDALMSVAYNNNAETVATSITCFVPLNFSVFNNMSSFIDTSFVEQLEINVSLNNSTDVFQAGTSITLDTANSAMIFYYLNMSEADTRSLQNSNYDVSRPLSVLTKSYYKESDVSQTTAEFKEFTVKMPINCPNLITRTILGLYKKSGSTTSFNGQIGNFVPISKVKIYSSGRVIYEYKSTEEEILENALFFNKGKQGVMYNDGDGTTALSSLYGSNLFVHNWGIAGNDNQFSGGVSGKGSSNLYLEASFTPVNNTSTAYTLVCENEYLSIVSTSGGSGKISSSISL